MVFVGVLDAANAQQRYQGLKEALAGSNMQIIDVRTDNTDRVRAKSNAADTLVNNPDIAGMVGLWSYNGPAILSAVKEANKVDKVKIVAFDEEDQTLTGIKDGAIYATVVQQPFEFGYRSMELMAKYSEWRQVSRSGEQTDLRADDRGEESRRRRVYKEDQPSPRQQLV